MEKLIGVRGTDLKERIRKAPNTTVTKNPFKWHMVFELESKIATFDHWNFSRLRAAVCINGRETLGLALPHFDFRKKDTFLCGYDTS